MDTGFKDIHLKEVSDGYRILISGSIYHSGERVRTNKQLIEMIELIAEVILGYKVYVTRR